MTLQTTATQQAKILKKNSPITVSDNFNMTLTVTKYCTNFNSICTKLLDLQNELQSTAHFPCKTHLVAILRRLRFTDITLIISS